MSQILIRAFDNEKRPVPAGNQPVDRTYFNLRERIPGIEAMREKFR
jgi:hypothetical protein